MAHPKTLVIYYRKTKSKLGIETFHNIENPDKIISNRNAPFIKKANYGGKRYDLSKHLSLYSERAINAALEAEKEFKGK